MPTLSDRLTEQMRRLAMPAVVAGLAIVCYWPALRGGIVWDDQAHVTAAELRSWTGLFRIWTDLHATQQYYPVLHSAFWLEFRLWGEAVTGYHLINVLWHVVSCCLLARVLRVLCDGSPPRLPMQKRNLPPRAEWLAAYIFAVHPVCVESVAWITEQKNTLSLVFYLSAGVAYLQFDSSRRPRTYCVASVFFALALATKSVTASLPAALLVVIWWRDGELSWRRNVCPLVPWFVAAAAAGLFSAWVERKFIGAEGAAFELSIIQRSLLAGRVVWFYVGKLLWPVDLLFVYPRWSVANAPGWYVGSLGVLIVTAAAWLIRRRCPGLLAGWLFFVGSLFPVLGFLNVYPFVFSYVADHFQYHASLGLIAVFACGVGGALARASFWIRRVGWGLVGGLLLVLGFMANRQSATFVDAPTLYRATLEKNPECWMAHNNLAVILVQSPEREADAIAHYREALRLKPDYAEAHNNMAAALARQPGHELEAIEHCKQALRIQRDYPEAECNLANVLSTLPGRESEALQHYAQALRVTPENPEIHFCVANLLAKLPGRLPNALEAYAEALRLRPRYVEAHVNLANALATVPGRLPEALEHYEQALRIDPNLAEVHYNLAVHLADVSGRKAEAEKNYLEALRLRPNHAKAHNNLAVLLARQRRWDEARTHWERALEINPDFEDARNNLKMLERTLQR